MAQQVPGGIAPYGKGAAQIYGPGAYGKGQPWGKDGAYDKGYPWGKGAAKPYGAFDKGYPGMDYGLYGKDAYGKGRYRKPFWLPTAGGGFAKQYPPGMAGIPYAVYPGYGLVQ